MKGDLTVDERKEASELYEAVMRLCAEADHGNAVLASLALAILDYARLNNQDDCCVLSNMFRLYTTGDNKDTEPNQLLGKMLQHLVDNGQIKAERL